MLLKLAQLWTPRVSSHEPKIVCNKTKLDPDEAYSGGHNELTSSHNQHWHGCRVILWVVAQGKTTVKTTTTTTTTIKTYQPIQHSAGTEIHINKWATSEKQNRTKKTPKLYPKQKNKKNELRKYGVKSPALNKCVMPNEVVHKYVCMLALPVIIKKYWRL